MRTVLTVALVSAHVLLGVGWVGAMGYSLGVAQPKAARYFGADDERLEEFLTTLAHGARWKVVGLLAALGLTGLGLIALAAPAERDAAWWTAVAAKTALLLLAAALFWRVSWRWWPGRVFALPAERPVWRRRFRYAAIAMTAAATLAAILGIAIAQ